MTVPFDAGITLLLPTDEISEPTAQALLCSLVLVLSDHALKASDPHLLQCLHYKNIVNKQHDLLI